MLRAELDSSKSHSKDQGPPILHELSPAQVVDELRHQLDAFWRSEWPFNNQTVQNDHSLGWWESLRDHPHARILAVSAIFFSAHALSHLETLIAPCHQDFLNPH